jgi:uncharacterized protein YfaS (alpha-2-macroglobulin family)
MELRADPLRTVATLFEKRLNFGAQQGLGEGKMGDQKMEEKKKREESASSEKPSVTLPATVEKVIKPADPRLPEKAQIAIEGAEELYREVRIENALTDEKGHEVALKEGAKVEVTVKAKPEGTTEKT